MLGLTDGELVAGSRIELPTRAHGITVLPDGSLVAVARRPGDWLLRWQPGQRQAAWSWAAAGTVFHGHAVLDRHLGRPPRLLVTQSDVHTGAGQVGALDLRTMESVDAWPTHGLDPHALLLHRGLLWVANGGIRTTPETGRAKLDLDAMDSSLVAIAPRTGVVQQQWRLDDRRLSVRHLAASRDGRIGAALQAEHDDEQLRARSPLLAVLDDDGLRPIAPPEDVLLGGYAGDIVGGADGFVLSATRAGRVIAWSADRGWRTAALLDEACPLAVASDEVVAGGRRAASMGLTGEQAQTALRVTGQFDNHWQSL